MSYYYYDPEADEYRRLDRETDGKLHLPSPPPDEDEPVFEVAKNLEVSFTIETSRFTQALRRIRWHLSRWAAVFSEN